MVEHMFTNELDQNLDKEGESIVPLLIEALTLRVLCLLNSFAITPKFSNTKEA